MDTRDNLKVKSHLQPSPAALLVPTYSLCPIGKVQVEDCRCYDCDLARVKAVLVLRSHNREVPVWLQCATGLYLLPK